MEYRPCRSAAYKRTLALEARLAEQSKRLREQANLLPAGKERDQLLSKASQADTGSRLSQWLTSPGLQPQISQLNDPLYCPIPSRCPGPMPRDSAKKRTSAASSLRDRGLLVACGHKNDGPLRSRCLKPALQLDPGNSSEVNVKQQAGCRLHAVALKQCLGRGEGTAVDAVVR